MSKDKLSAARQEIDLIDREIHSLLARRETQVNLVNEAKRASEEMSGIAYRPFREAAMMQALAARHKQSFPFISLEHIWREMIAGFTQLQQPYKLHLLSPDLDSLSAARFHFGFCTPFVFHADTDSLLEAMAPSPADLMFWPLTLPLSLFQSLNQTKGLTVFSRLPFFTDRVPLSALVLGVGTSEKGDEAEDYFLLQTTSIPRQTTLLAQSDSLSLVACKAGQLSASEGQVYCGSGPAPTSFQ